MKKIMVIVSNGFEELELFGAIDTPKRAGIQVDIFRLHGSYVTSALNTTIMNTRLLSEANMQDYDLLLIPGGPHYAELEASEQVNEAILYFYNNRKYIAAICAGPTILGHLGLLTGKNYTCFTSMNEPFGGNYKEDYAVVDLPFITGKSAAAAIDFGLAITKVLTGEDACNIVKARIYYKD